MVGEGLKSSVLASWQALKSMSNSDSFTIPYHRLPFLIHLVLFVPDTIWTRQDPRSK
jgi:hypothetical protein